MFVNELVVNVAEGNPDSARDCDFCKSDSSYVGTPILINILHGAGQITQYSVCEPCFETDLGKFLLESMPKKLASKEQG